MGFSCIKRIACIQVLFLWLSCVASSASIFDKRDRALEFAGDLGAMVMKDRDGRVTGTRFRVWAPNAGSVSVIGTFNRWNGDRHPMTMERTGGVWSVEIPSAKPGDEYLFLINGELRRKDPRARMVTASDGNCVIYDTGAFDWGDALDFKSSGSLRDLVIYQLHPGTFHDPDPNDGEPGTLTDAIAKLDHLVELGVNCVLLMPVNEFHGRHSWGYNPSDLFAIESSYGGPDALKEFVKACHERGLAVHVDIVHNHYGPQDLDLVRFDGYGGGDNRNGIYFYEDAERGDTPWGPRPDFGRREVRDFIRDNVRMWFLEYRIDGLRWDSTVNIRAVDNGRTPNPEGEKMLHRISKMIAKEFPGKISIAEDSVGDPRFHGSWEYDFHHGGGGGLVPQIVERPDRLRDIGDIARRIDSELGFRRVIYSENHDEVGRLNGKRRILMDVDEDDPLGLEARRKAALAAATTLTSPGVPLVFMGQELLETEEFHDSNPLDWGRGDVSFHNARLYRDLVRLRRNLDERSAGLTSPDTRIVKSDPRRKLLTWRRYLPGRAGQDIYVVANFGGEPIEDHPVYFPQSGEWTLLLNTDDTKYGPDRSGMRPASLRTDSRGQIAVSIAPYSAQIYGVGKHIPEEIDMAAMREEWEAAHGEPVADAAAAVPDATPRPVEDDVAPPEPEWIPFASNAGQFVVLVNFSQPHPWDPSNPDFRMGIIADWLWRAEMGFVNGFDIAFKIMDPATGLEYGGNGIVQERMPVIGTMVEGGPPILVRGPLNGGFILSFNERDLRFRFERRAESRHHRISIMGTFNNWDPGADLMTMAGDHLWETEIVFDDAREAAFVFIADGSLDKQWGGGGVGLPASGVAEELGEPIRFDVPLDGPHRITFNELTGDFTVEPLDNSAARPLPPVPEVRPVEEIHRIERAAR